MAAPGAAPPAMSPEEQAKVDQHEREIEEREAFEYWGYLFKSDKTGTDKLKALLRGLKQHMNEVFASEHPHTDPQPDLTPDQLARFYRELNGNYDQLFLGTPSESIAFIYKSLGCLHSLQPQAFTHSTAFTDPTVPALKTEGWIMWQTIQLLLGPDEHYAFLSEAVQKWEIKDPDHDEIFPKLLPRQCFPMEPDKHMVAWYEGVSERLRKEAEEEERSREIEAERAEVRRLRSKVEDPHLTDDEGSVDSRAPALAYFRNPLYRHVDGRPSIVRRGSKRPALSPRPTFADKGKEAAISAGHVIRNIGSPHLWDGRGSRHASREREHESRDRRRRSLPDHRYSGSGPYHHPGDPPPAAAGAHDSAGLSPHEARHRRRRSSQQQGEAGASRPTTAGTSVGSDADESSAYASPLRSPPQHHHYHPHRPPHLRRDSHLRHSRSAEPTPSQREGNDYFYGYDDPSQRRNSAQDSEQPGTPPANNGGGGFGPSASPLFATHVARNPPPMPPPPTSVPPQARPPPPRESSADNYAPRKTPSMRRAHGRPYTSSPDRHHDRREDPRRYDSPRRPRFEQSPAGFDRDDDPRGPPPPMDGHRRPPSRSFDLPHHAPYPPGPGGMPSGPGRRPPSTRHSGSEMPPPFPPDDRRQGRPKTARFDNPPPMGDGRHVGPGGPPPRRSVSRGVDGRRYVDESPWSRA